MALNESAIEQINLRYHQEEDRLLFKIGLADKTEVSFWMTRRVCKAMWSSLQIAGTPTHALFSSPVISTHDAKDQAVESFALEASNQKKIEDLDFKSEYLTDRKAWSEQPMLAVQCLVVSVDQIQSRLDLQFNNGQSIAMTLKGEMVHAISDMMQQTLRQAGWDLFLMESYVQVDDVSIARVLH